MQLNIALLKAKLPYFIILFLSGMYANYLYHGFLMRDIIICALITTYMLMYPHVFCLYSKDHEYDEYDFTKVLPSYLVIICISFFGLIMSNYIWHTSINLVTIISITILLVFNMGVIDRSRYN